MEELMEYNNYGQFKAALDKELLSAADHFVKIGFLLKQARDTTILYESGYPNLYEFAKAEYGIDRGTVSRYIAINDRFSVGGNSPTLEQRYSRRGVAKLQEMLTMSDEVIAVIPEETTKSELQEIKRDIRAEENITDMEVMLEDAPKVPVDEMDQLYQKSLYYFLREETEVFTRVYGVVSRFDDGMARGEDIMTALAPSGIATPRTRVPKVGTVLMSIQGADQPMAFVNVRTNEHQTVGWDEITELLKGWIGQDQGSAEEKYRRIYETDMPGQQDDQNPEHEAEAVVDNDVDNSVEEVEETEMSMNPPEKEEETPEKTEDKAEAEEVEQINEDQIEVIEEKADVAPVQPQRKEPTGQQLAEIREWVPVKVKSVPDEEGKYLICREGYTKDDLIHDIDSVKLDERSKTMDWVLWKNRVVFWMPLPPLPVLEEYDHEDEDVDGSVAHGHIMRRFMRKE